MKRNKVLQFFGMAIGIIAILFVAIFTYTMIKFNADKGKKFESYSFTIEDEVRAANLELGERIVHVRAGCIDCHGEDLTGRMVMDNPAMGTIHAPNITPHRLADWTDTQIARAIRYGVSKDGHSLRFMPSFDYENYSKGDIAAIIKYLRSVPAIESEYKESTFGPMAKILSALNKMPIMFPAKAIAQDKGFGFKPAEEATLQFGQYLANTCVGCHGPELRGGPIPGGDPSWPHAPNIRLGVNKVWNEEVFTQMIKTGISPTSNNKLRAPMPIALLKQYNQTEIDALWLFLSSLE